MAAEEKQDNGSFLPSLGAVLAVVIGAAGLLYPFGLAVLERQLELAYELDPASAWHATALVSQTEAVIHGLQALIAGTTLVLGFLYVGWILLAANSLFAVGGIRLMQSQRDARRQQLKSTKEELEQLAKKIANIEKRLQAAADDITIDVRKLSDLEKEQSDIKLAYERALHDSTVPFADLAAWQIRIDADQANIQQGGRFLTL